MTAPTTTPVATLLLRPRDPLIVRDGRPFGPEPGARAATLPWPLPQTLAGALRTHLGETAGFDWRTDGPDKALAISVHGGFPVALDDDADRLRVYLPAPRDALILDRGAASDARWALRCLRPDPLRDGEGMDVLPTHGLRPLTPPEDAKAYDRLAFWSLDDTVRWLAAPTGTASLPEHGLRAPERETRVHVAVNAATGTARDGALFSTSGLVFADGRPRRWHPPTRFAAPSDGGEHRPPVRVGAVLGMLARVEGDLGERPVDSALLAMGGERRVVAVEPADAALWPALPPSLREAVGGATRLRLQLATPALFAGGWRPGWLEARSLEGGTALVGRPPGWDGPALRLVGAAVGRRIPVSGWDLRQRQPKPIRHAVPAGSVYFFESLGEPLGPDAATALWLRPIGDTTIDGRDARQNARDGYGLALPGIWDVDPGSTATTPATSATATTTRSN